MSTCSLKQTSDCELWNRSICYRLSSLTPPCNFPSSSVASRLCWKVLWFRHSTFCIFSHERPMDCQGCTSMLMEEDKIQELQRCTKPTLLHSHHFLVIHCLFIHIEFSWSFYCTSEWGQIDQQNWIAKQRKDCVHFQPNSKGLEAIYWASIY